MIVVAGAFGFSDIVMMKYIAFGMIFALLIDATIVRMLLVPAVMHLLREDNWWAPRFLTRLTHRLGGDNAPAAEPALATASAAAPAPTTPALSDEEAAPTEQAGTPEDPEVRTEEASASEAPVRGDRSADTHDELIPFSELVQRLKSTDCLLYTSPSPRD